MVTIKNKLLILAAGGWLLGILLLLLGAYSKPEWVSAGTLLTVGITLQAIGFGLLGYVIIQAAFSKKKS